MSGHSALFTSPVFRTLQLFIQLSGYKTGFLFPSSSCLLPSPKSFLLSTFAFNAPERASDPAKTTTTRATAALSKVTTASDHFLPSDAGLCSDTSAATQQARTSLLTTCLPLSKNQRWLLLFSGTPRLRPRYASSLTQSYHITNIYVQLLQVIHDHAGGKRSVARLARTCKALKEPSLNVLWKDLDSILPLVGLFPANIMKRPKRPALGLNKMPVDADWKVSGNEHSSGRFLIRSTGFAGVR